MIAFLLLILLQTTPCEVQSNTFVEGPIVDKFVEKLEKRLDKNDQEMTTLKQGLFTRFDEQNREMQRIFSRFDTQNQEMKGLFTEFQQNRQELIKLRQEAKEQAAKDAQALAEIEKQIRASEAEIARIQHEQWEVEQAERAKEHQSFLSALGARFRNLLAWIGGGASVFFILLIVFKFVI